MCCSQPLLINTKSTMQSMIRQCLLVLSKANPASICTALGNALRVVLALTSELSCKRTANSDQAVTYPLRTHLTPPHNQ